MTRGSRLISRSKARLTLAGVLVVALLSSLSAAAHWSSSGTGTGSGSTGTLHSPSITGATPGAGTVGLTWSTVTPPGSPAVTYYVQRGDGVAGGDCPASASPTGVTSCTDSGLSAGIHDCTVTAVWKTWTATSATGTVTVTAATLDHFTIAPASGTRTAGTPFGVTVTAKDASNNTITSYTGTVHFTSNDGAADLPADYTFTTGGGNDNGVHTFTSGVTLKTAGTGKTASVADGGATGTGTYAVVHAAASQVALTGAVTDLASGTPRMFTATVEDAYGNAVDTGADSTVSVSFAQTVGTGSVTGSGSSAAVAGVATTSLSGDVAGSVTVRASATLLAGAAASNVLTFNVMAGAASQLALTGAVTDLASGSVRTFTATVQDATGNTVTTGADSTMSVSFAKTAGAGSVSGTGSPAAVAGVATKSLTGDLGGSVTVRASASLVGPGAVNSNTLTFNVVAGAASQVALSGAITDLGSGSARTFTATVQGAAGNTVTTGADSTVNVSFAQTGGTGSVTGTGSSTAVAGVATKSLTGYVSGSMTVRASATLLAGSTISNVLAFNVVAGAAARLAFTTSPNNSSGGTAFTTQPVVTVQDAGGNTVTGDMSNVTLAITGGTGSAGAALSCTANPKAAVAGVAAFAGCKIDRAGAGYTVTATDGSLTSAVSTGFDIVVGAAAKLAFTTSPNNSTGGTASTTQPVVTVQDAGGNTVTGDTSNVTLAITGGTGTAGAALTCTANPKAAASGLATFAGCKIDKAGSGYTLTATDGSLTSAVSTSFDITVGAAAALVLAAASTTPTAGVADNLTVTAVDAGANTVTSYTGDKSLTFGGAATIGASLPTISNKTGVATTFGTSTIITFSSGVATVSGANNGAMKLFKAETACVTVTDGSINNGAGLSVTVSAAAASKFAFTSAALTGTASSTASLGPATVEVQDSFGNLRAVAANMTVNLASNSTGTRIFATTLNGTNVTSVTVTTGNSSVNFFYGDARAGSPVITASGALTSATQTETITAGAAAVMAFINCSTPVGNATCTGQPIPMANNSNMTFNIQTQDAFGNASAPASALSIAISGDADFTITIGTLAAITSPATTSGSITVRHNNSNTTATITAHVTSGPAVADATMTVKR